MKLVIAVVTSVFMLLSAQVNASQLEDELARDWKNNVVIVRVFPVQNEMRVDKGGNVLNKVHSGYWSSDGMVKITDISVRSDQLRASGKRVVTWFNNRSGKFQNEITKQDFDLKVDLDPTWKSADDVRPLLERLLSRDAHDLKALAPDYWQSCLEGMHQTGKSWLCGTDKKKTSPVGLEIESAPSSAKASPEKQAPVQAAQPVIESAVTQPIDETSKPGDSLVERGTAVGANAAAEQPGTRAYRVGGKVKAPQTVFTPDPQYVERASKVALQGTSLLLVRINERGEPDQIRIQGPLGGGLDDKAVEAVKKWKFKPATIDGRPVTVQVNVELNFHLY